MCICNVHAFLRSVKCDELINHKYIQTYCLVWALRVLSLGATIKNIQKLSRYDEAADSHNLSYMIHSTFNSFRIYNQLD